MDRGQNTAPALTAEMVVDGLVPSSPAVSPDGRQLAYVVAPVGRSGEYPVSALWVAATDGATPPRRLTAGIAHESSPRWVSDSVFYLSAERGVTQLYRIRPDAGRPEALTSWTGGISGYLPLAEPDTVAFIAPDEPTGDDELRRRERDDAKVWGEDVRPDRLRLLDVRTGRVRTPAVHAHRHVVEAVQRPGGGPFALLTWPVPEPYPGLLGAELHVWDPVGGLTLDLGSASVEASSLAWWKADDGWHLTYLAVTPPAVVGGLAVLDVAVPSAPGHTVRRRNLTAGADRCPTDLVPTVDGAPLVVFADGLDTAVCRLEAAGQPGFAELFRVDGLAESPSASDGGGVVAMVVSAAHEPRNVHVGRTDGRLTRLTDTRPELRGVRWGVQERLSYRASDGLALDGLLILPPGRTRPDGPYPLVTLAHGGPHGRHADQFMLDWFPSGQWLATAGYAVFLPNPRGGKGHGHEFAARVAGAVGGDEFGDILTGIDLLVAEGVADPDRLGIAGWSHGGFLAAWAVGRTDRFRAGLTGAGISDWGMLVSTGEYGTLEAGLCGGTDWDGAGPHRHDRLSPISFRVRGAHPRARRARRGRHEGSGLPGGGVSPGAAQRRCRARLRRVPERGPRDPGTQPPATCSHAPGSGSTAGSCHRPPTAAPATLQDRDAGAVPTPTATRSA